ncbi:hypothetical protein [Streptomyces gossypiisoli]|nr:hypothetical protein [Streptomyces gossypiisoli]
MRLSNTYGTSPVRLAGATVGRGQLLSEVVDLAVGALASVGSWW